MKDKDLKNFKPNGGIRPSPLKAHNGLIANILQSPSLSNGTKTGQNFSLYDAFVELCKEKKCSDSMWDDAAAIPKTNRSEPDVF